MSITADKKIKEIKNTPVKKYQESRYQITLFKFKGSRFESKGK